MYSLNQFMAASLFMLHLSATSKKRVLDTFLDPLKLVSMRNLWHHKCVGHAENEI